MLPTENIQQANNIYKTQGSQVSIAKKTLMETSSSGKTYPKVMAMDVVVVPLT